jgi:hypothetical protein
VQMPSKQRAITKAARLSYWYKGNKEIMYFLRMLLHLKSLWNQVIIAALLIV